MSQIVIREIDAAHNKDARIPNQPFEIWGRMIPSIDHGKWSYEVKKMKSRHEIVFLMNDIMSQKMTQHF
ncbi:MAG: hypothetical protein SPE36_10290 [Lactobacillus johnsonii]|nr:hypothetical protein [Lactobacillus johnsonii]